MCVKEHACGVHQRDDHGEIAMVVSLRRPSREPGITTRPAGQ
jgi:hypothetical protein